jgi:isocitrate lyase
MESRSFATHKDDYMAAVDRMADSLFNFKKTFSVDELRDFRLEIMKEVYAFEFRMYKGDQGNIDGVDFARSIIKYAENSYKRKLLRRIFNIEEDIQDYKIS